MKSSVEIDIWYRNNDVSYRLLIFVYADGSFNIRDVLHTGADYPLYIEDFSELDDELQALIGYHLDHALGVYNGS